MAKKKRKYLIKLNNKVRNYFDGLPFDEGITTLDDERLVALSMLLELELPSLSRDEMIRTLRRAWSEGDHVLREHIIRHLLVDESREEVYVKAKPLDKVGKILMLLEEIEHSKDEESKILESFIETKSSKITEEKIWQKLTYIRLQSRFGLLEESLEVSFNTLNEMEFYQSYCFGMREVDFTKLLLTHSVALMMDDLLELDDSVIIEQLKDKKSETIIERQKYIDLFIAHTSQDHP